ncbi:isopentenyl phosphate kinase [Candidatus Korarchaeum cryptofilum]|jgi:isopentenyl phosphate kinase|nr:isopentenyl phosphate kinase [Candidatus Korarchaeum cryptofilum]
MLYVKLGGSLITLKKEGRKEIRSDVLRRISIDIKSMMNDFKIFLAHGAGHYGHEPVLRSGLHLGMGDWNRIGASETMVGVSELNFRVAKIMMEEGIPVAPLPPRSMMRRNNGRILCETSSLKELIKAGFIPLMHGDLIPDDERGVYVLSADEIPLHLDLGFEKVIYLMDEPGVLDEAGRVIPVINRSALEGMSLPSLDATGSIRGKIESAVRLAERGVEVRISGYRDPGDLIRAINGEIGTRVI